MVAQVVPDAPQDVPDVLAHVILVVLEVAPANAKVDAKDGVLMHVPTAEPIGKGASFLGRWKY